MEATVKEAAMLTTLMMLLIGYATLAYVVSSSFIFGIETLGVLLVSYAGFKLCPAIVDFFSNYPLYIIP